jgi:hypothetical protein
LSLLLPIQPPTTGLFKRGLQWRKRMAGRKNARKLAGELLKKEAERGNF